MIVLVLALLLPGGAAQCDCVALDQCVNDLQLQKQLQLAACRDSCLTTAPIQSGNPTGVQQCYSAKDSAKLTQSQAQLTCVEQQIGRPCSGASNTLPPIFPGTLAPVNPSNTLPPIFPGGFDTNRNSSSRNNNNPWWMSNNGNRRGKRHISRDINVPSDLRSYESCVNACVRTTTTQLQVTTNRRASFGRNDFGGLFNGGWWRGFGGRVKRGSGGSCGRRYYSDCASRLGCSLRQQSGRRNAERTCRDQQSAANQQIYTQFCACLQQNGVQGVSCTNIGFNRRGFNSFFSDRVPAQIEDDEFFDFE